MFGGQHHRAIIQADVVDGHTGNRAIRWGDRQGAGGEILPLWAILQRAVSTMRRCLVPSHSIRASAIVAGTSWKHDR